ncbi:DUF6233 domain-containing protein [Streptomyces sp. NPDC058664]|uniref:DUF6233 domain-containing protein n=1 Tax=unclassified Streptomyces TaxID=2593676 RepID=UPI00366889FF
MGGVPGDRPGLGKRQRTVCGQGGKEAVSTGQRSNGHAAAPITVLLPGGQEVRGRLHARRQTKSGWQYLVGFLVWQDTADGSTEAVEHRAWVSPPHVRPLSGTSYAHVPTHRPSPADSIPLCKGQPAWTLQDLPHRPGHPGATLLHVIGCTPSDRTLNREQALTALQQPRAAACRECKAADSLTGAP